MALLNVGPGQTYSTIAAAVNASAEGDTIDVQAGTYQNDFFYISHSLTLQAVNGEAHIVANGQGLAGKAAIIVNGANVAINGFEVSGVAVDDKNGAAIRYEGGNLSLTDDYFHDNQEGLLGNSDDPSGTISVHHSEFAFNGDGSGFTHNFYAGAVASVSIDNSYFHDAIVGHEIKSRAASTTVTNSRIFDNNSTASYSIDAPNGGNVTISGNQIEQGPNSENSAIFAYGEEGSRGGSASVDANTIVNDRDGGHALVGGPVSFTNNHDWNLPLGGNNVDLTTRPSLDTSSLAFISQPGAPGGGGGPPPDGNGSGDSGGGSPPPPPPAPPPAMSLDDYHSMVVSSFFAYAGAHPEVFTNVSAINVWFSEVTSTTVPTGPVPGDLWS
jgi:hypothetical protein